ncbi:ABC transporter permease subunit [Pseudonocardiaceae bacterium YIM PH 21723]|nr:ABC transporter permease subunit [Pseudonocardiaceae bacterium YIM PH 21723]
MALTYAPVRTRAQRPAISARKKKRSFLPPRWLSPIVLILLWQLASSTGVLHEDTLASPVKVAGVGWELLLNGELIEALAVSGQRVAIGFLIGAVVAIVLGVITGLSRVGDAVLDSPLQMLRTLPFLGLSPLFIVWFGIDELPKVILVALGTLFPLYLGTYAGIRNTDAKLIEATRVLGFTRTEQILHVVLPGALQQTLVGLRQALGMAWLALIIGEQVNANAGLGFMINNAREFLRTDVIVVGLIVYAVLGLGSDVLVRFIERRALQWQPVLTRTSRSS